MGPEEPRAAFNISINKLMCGDDIGSDQTIWGSTY